MKSYEIVFLCSAAVLHSPCWFRIDRTQCCSLPTSLLFMWICGGSEMNDHRNHKVHIRMRTVSFEKTHLYRPKRRSSSSFAIFCPFGEKWNLPFNTCVYLKQLRNDNIDLIYVFCGLNQRGFKIEGKTKRTGSLDATPNLVRAPTYPPSTNPRSSAAQTAARCHTLHPRCQQRVTEAADGMCVPSGTHVSVKDCQIVSNSSHPTLKYCIV